MNPDFLDLLRALLDADVKFMIVGAYAVGVHGHPRATKDLDVWVDASAENAPRVIAALGDFGAPLMGLTEQELHTPGAGLQIGVPPMRVDIITKISGLSFNDAWPSHITASFSDGLTCPVIGIESLIKNKTASGRPQDIADVVALETILRSRT